MDWSWIWNIVRLICCLAIFAFTLTTLILVAINLERWKDKNRDTHKDTFGYPLKCSAHRQPPSGLSGYKLFELPLFPNGDFHISVGNAYFPGAGAHCEYVSTVTGKVYRDCGSGFSLWIDLSSTVESGIEQEGLIGFHVSPDGTKAYTHYHTETSNQIRPPPPGDSLEWTLEVACNITFFNPDNEIWKTLPSAGRAQVVEWDLQGSNDSPVNPFTLIAYDQFGLEHNGVDSLRLQPEDDNILLIAMADQQQFWELGRFLGPDQFNAKVWAMDLRKRRQAPSMNGPAPRRLSQLPPNVANSLTLVMDGLRQGNAPAMDSDVYRDGDPLLWQWMMGHQSGEPTFALKGLVGERPRHTGWPIYSGLGYTTSPIIRLCQNLDTLMLPTLSAEQQRMIDVWSEGHPVGFSTNGGVSAKGKPELFGVTFKPSWLHHVARINEYLDIEDRYLPAGFSPGRVAANAGPLDDRGVTSGSIGSGLIRMNKGECPIGVTGSFTDVFNLDDGSVFFESPYVQQKYNMSIQVPQLSVWLPEWSTPERQSKTYHYQLADVLKDQIMEDGDGSAYRMSSLSSSPQHDRLYVSFFTFPAQSSPKSQTWVVFLE